MKKINIIFISIITSLLVISESFACSCMRPESPEKSLEKATSVFIGKVINLENKSLINGKIGSKDIIVLPSGNIKVTFEVSDIIKGENNKNITLETPNNSAACGYNFKEDNEYIVYTNGEEGNLKTYLCSRTSSTENAKEDLEVFKNFIGKKTDFNKKSENKLDLKNIYLIILIVSLIIILGMKRKKDLKAKKELENK